VQESSSFLAQLLNRKEVAYIIVFKKGFHPQQLMSIEAYFPQKPFLQATKPAHANLHMRKQISSKIQHHHFQISSMLFSPGFRSQNT
jgi:hypothetical protein